jgi:imidazolonepropionase-like amidohydrolase
MATGAMLSPENEDARAIQFTVEELKAAVEIARDNFKHTAAHAHACQGIINAVEAGVDFRSSTGRFADERALRLMAERKVTLVPTFCAVTSMLADPAVGAAMPTHLRERLINSRATRQEMVRQAYRLGVPLAMGTDAGTPGNHQRRQLPTNASPWSKSPENRPKQFGRPTIGGARLLRQEGNLGSHDPGKFADLIATRENPLNDIQ